ncbi:hypothetical protein VOA_003392 [Vibrio sp. RC586]|uniref:DUF3179 domain-containing (seleno)protein n=1 Tax=Vibrio sp. RC586 TaxID=675815 RepID=UPI0001BB867E|nr:DUF3179 domain-containing (seleno)protein [Vibrio sp. RC586]EEZ00942.1 hypothetical protein VOA_003392 [Vibrio sp. RC586]
MHALIQSYGLLLFGLLSSIAIFTSGLLFKELADISQWVIQSERHKTMRVWYHRHRYSTVTLLALFSSWAVYASAPNIAPLWTVLLSSGAVLFFYYSGYINPHIMMRARMKDGMFVSVAQAKRYYADDESVIVLEVNGEARAHSDKDLLRPHVAGSGLIGGENVVMTYCGLSNLGVAYTPEINGVALELAPMNQLENNLVMWDKNSGEPIQQLWGRKECEVGSTSVESKMREWPTFRMPFKKFALAYPEGEVFINDYLAKDTRVAFWKNPLLAVYDFIMDFIFTTAIKHQSSKDSPTFPTIKNKDNRLANKTHVWGLSIGDDHVAYTEEFVRQQGNILNTTIGGKAVVVFYDTNYQSLVAFYNSTGHPIEEINFFGETAHGELPRVESMKAGIYWMIWANFFPNTALNRL